MRFVVLGAGAVGGVVGGRLSQAGHDVVLIARGEHLARLRSDGLTIEDPDGEVTLPVPAVGGPAEVDWRPGDVVLLAVKSQDTDAALDTLLDALAPGTTPPAIACLQNGVENERRALRRFTDVYGINVMLPADFLTPGAVVARSAPVTGALNVGRYPSGVDDTATRIAEAFASSSFMSDATEAVMGMKYAKLLLNLGNAVDALLGDDAGFTSTVSGQARDEARRVLDAAGIQIAAEGFDAHQREYFTVRPVKGQPRGGGSTWQSLARGIGSVETDYLNGEIVLLGRLHGVPTPVNGALQQLMARAVRERWQPGSMTSDVLAAAIDAHGQV